MGVTFSNYIFNEFFFQQELFESCGGDQASAMAWPSLLSADLSYNNIEQLDDSLVCIILCFLSLLSIYSICTVRWVFYVINWIKNSAILKKWGFFIFNLLGPYSF